jgi:hypothetical protein
MPQRKTFCLRCRVRHAFFSELSMGVFRAKPNHWLSSGGLSRPPSVLCKCLPLGQAQEPQAELPNPSKWVALQFATKLMARPKRFQSASTPRPGLTGRSTGTSRAAHVPPVNFGVRLLVAFNQQSIASPWPNKRFSGHSTQPTNYDRHEITTATHI